MQNITNKKRFLFLSLAIVFTFAVLMLSFAPKSVAKADTNSNALIYNGSPYSTVLTETYNYTSDHVTGDGLSFAGGCNFQIENNFALYSGENSNYYKYYLFSNQHDVASGIDRYNTYFVGFDFIETSDSLESYGSFSVNSYAYSSVSTDTQFTRNALRITNSKVSDMSQFANYYGDIISNNSSLYPEYLLLQDELGWYYTFEYGVTYYLIFFDHSGDFSIPNSRTFYRTLELYCSAPFNAVETVNVSNSNMSFSVFNNNFFQGIPAGNDKPNSVKFTYNSTDNENYLSVNCYASHEAFSQWSEYFNYSRMWYVDPPDLTDNQYYQNGYNVGKNDGYLQGVKDGNKDAYDLGYTDGYEEGNSEGYEQGSSISTKNAYDRGFQAGKTEGIASANDYTFLGLFGAVIDAPITALNGLLNFNLLGFNLANFFYALVTCAVIIFVIRIILAK